MRRVPMMLLLSGMLVLGLVTGVLAGPEVTRTIQVIYRGITLRVNDQPVVSDTEPFIVAATSRTMVPARAMAEALGARVEWDEQAGAVQVYSADYVAITAWEVTTGYRLPAHGVSLTAPGTWGRTLYPGAVLALRHPNGLAGALLQRTPAPALEPDDLTDHVLAGMEALAGGSLEIISRTPGHFGAAAGYLVSARSLGTEYRLAILYHRGAAWVLTAYARGGATADQRASLDEVMRSLRAD